MLQVIKHPCININVTEKILNITPDINLIFYLLSFSPDLTLQAVIRFQMLLYCVHPSIQGFLLYLQLLFHLILHY